MKHTGEISIYNYVKPEASFTWRASWIQTHESPWGIIEKFRYVNQVTYSDIFSIFGIETVRNKKNRSFGESKRELINLSGLDKNLLESILGVDIVELNRNSIHQFTKNLPLKTESYIRTEVAVCPDCISNGFHSVYHQFIFLDYCPTHMKKLIDRCPNCRMTIPYSISGGKQRDPYTCICGYCYISNTLKDSFIETWENFGLYEIRDEKFITWLTLHEHPDLYRLKNIYFDNEIAEDDSAQVLVRLLSIVTKRDDSSSEGHHCVKTKSNIHKIINLEEKQETHIFTNKIESFYEQLYYVCRCTYKSIARNIRKNLKAHTHCIKNMMSMQSSRRICPYAYAYVMWRVEIEGIEVLDIRKWMENGLKKRRFRTFEGDFFSKPDTYHLDGLFRQWKKRNNLIYSDGGANTKWLTNKVLSQLLIDRYKDWLKLTKEKWELISEQLLSRGSITVKYPGREVKLTFFATFLSTDEQLEYHWWSRPDNPTNFTNLGCPYKQFKVWQQKEAAKNRAEFEKMMRSLKLQRNGTSFNTENLAKH